MELTQQQLKKYLHYNKDTGIFTRIGTTNKIRANSIGKPAGGINSDGYIKIRILNHRLSGHKLAFLYMLGSMPDGEVDHLNHDRSDNRWVNLRAVNKLHNQHNRSINSNNSSGANGIRLSIRDNYWHAYIMVHRKRIFLGSFKDKNEAICARLHANRLYKFHANHGK